MFDLELECYHSTVELRSGLGVVPPTETFALPLQQAQCRELRVRPHPTASAAASEIFGWSAPISLVSDGTESARSYWAICVHQHTSSESLKFIVEVIVSMDAYLNKTIRVMVQPPLLIRNLLPCPVRCKFDEAGSDSGFNTVALDQGAEMGAFHFQNTSGTIQFRMQLQDLKWSSAYRMPPLCQQVVQGGPGAANHKTAIVLEDAQGGKCKVFLEFSRSEGGALQLTIFAEYWLANRSGVALIFGGPKVAGASHVELAPLQTEAFTETVYQQQRRHPLGRWQKPFLPFDPQEWCNSCSVPQTLESVELPSSEWEWSGAWEVSVYDSAKDEEGWQYGFNFSDLQDTSANRTGSRVVRRRPWHRTRTRKKTDSGAPVCIFHPLNEVIQIKTNSHHASWSVPVQLMLGAKSVVHLIEGQSVATAPKRMFEIAVVVDVAPGKFWRSKVVTFTSRFTMVSHATKPLMLQQVSGCTQRCLHTLLCRCLH